LLALASHEFDPNSVRREACAELIERRYWYPNRREARGVRRNDWGAGLVPQTPWGV